tara:strand:- start:31 stop:399 length:369 start_codon:yes stop_codon:yes gene_type:complete
MANKVFKIMVPKAGSSDANGLTTKLYELDEIVNASEDWQGDLMNTFVENGWAMELKVDSPEEIAEEPAEEPETEVVRARNEDGSFKADDPSTPDINEAWEEKPVEEVTKTTKKRGRPKKTEG